MSIFVKSLPRVLSRVMGWKALGKSYCSFFGLGMMTDSAALSCDGQMPLSSMALKRLASAVSSGKSSKMNLRCHHMRWSPPGAKVLDMRARHSMTSATEMGGQEHSSRSGRPLTTSQSIAPEEVVLLKWSCM